MSNDAAAHARMKSAPTPGPWHAGGIFNPDSAHPTVNIWGPTPRGAQSGQVVAESVTLANATLILAAPELLKACETALGLIIHLRVKNFTELDRREAIESVLASALAKAIGPKRVAPSTDTATQEEHG